MGRQGLHDRYLQDELPLLSYKRLSDVYEDELVKLSQEFGDQALARQLLQARSRPLTREREQWNLTWTAA